MIDLFKMGGPLFMGILTAVLFIIIIISFIDLFLIIKKEYKSISELRRKLKYIKSLGLFAFVAGILSQLIGLYAAFSAIEKAKDISPAIMMRGLKISMISPMYGMIIFLISYILWIYIDYLASTHK